MSGRLPIGALFLEEEINMKSLKCLIAVCLSLLMLLALCACGQPSAPAEEPEAAVEAPAEPEAPAETETVGEDNEAEVDLKALAETMVGKDVSELIEAIGEPISRDYAPSCLGSGEDGELVYDGFTVYTYREGDAERVEEVYVP